MKDLDLKPISELDKDDKLLKAKQMRYEAYYPELDWIEQAQLAYAFKAGDQWSDAEIEIHKEQGRESMVWNYIHPVVELILGVLSQNPTRIRIAPVDRSDGFLGEVTEKLVEWVEENQTDSEAVEDEAFEDSLITGKGFVSLDIQPRPENPTEVQIIEETVPVNQVRVDPMSRKQDLSDARYVVTEKWVSLEDFIIRYPDHKEQIEEIFNRGADPFNNISSLEYYQGTAFDCADDFDVTTDYYNYDTHRVLIAQLEYFENYVRYYLVDPANPAQTQEIKEQDVENYPIENIIKVNAKKVRWLHFTNDIIMYDDDSPVYPDGFSTLPVYAYVDKKCKILQYYGIVKLMIDPQREANKRGMQTIRLMGNQGTGVYAEEGSFVDNEQAESSWSDPDEITWVNKNKLNSIKEKTTLDFPVASVQLHEIAKDSMKQITGVNPDMMGMAGTRQEPGMVVRMRQQQGLTIINKIFKNYKKLKKALHKRKVYLVMKYMPDWQIAKILGETDKFVIKDGHIIDKENNLIAPIRAIRDIKYNLKYEDAPGNMTKTMSELSIFLDMVGKKFPVDPLAIIDRLDITETAKARWKKYIEKSQQSQQQNHQAQSQAIQMKAQLENQKIVGGLEISNQKLQIENGKLQLLTQKTEADNILKKKDQELNVLKEQFAASQGNEKLKLERAKLVLEYQKFGEDKIENKREWFFKLSQDERDNLMFDLKTIGVIDKALTLPETTNINK